MVAHREVELARGAHVLEHHVVVLAARRHPVDDQVRQRALGGGERLVGLGLRRLGGLDLGGQLLAVGQQLGALVAARLADLLAQLTLLGTQRVGPPDGLPAPLVGGQQRIHGTRVLAAGPLRGAQRFRVVTKQFQVDHSKTA
ncbi:MAG: hypothetical protein QOG57_3897 [Pseudonocardiales bacterium]|nr:hypothetical protein [Pseudonocardiales bacterium]